IVCGDFNLYGSTEPAYQKLLLDTGGNEGHFIDPITMTGTWNDPLYSIRHTQSPRVRALGDGGSTGGMDDRFDLVLYSQAISLNGGMKYINNSQIAYGNDGTLYNDSINHPSNTAVSPTIANALHNAADHIPVLSSFTFEYSTSSVPTDFGATALINPQTPMCGNANQSMAVQIKNHGGVSVDFATNPLDVFLQVTTPSAGILTFSETISSGNISGGTNLTVNFNALINMSASGTYSFRAYTVQVNDVNSLNDSLPPVSIVVSSTSNPTINPPGPQSICSGDSISLTASPGIAYLWSNGSTNPSITVMDTGNYSVQITIAGGCFATSSPVHVSHTLPPANGTVFVESMGTVAGTTTMATHEGNNGFDNDSYTMTGNADVRQTLASSGYLGSSGNANVFFTTAGRNFVIAGINTTGYTNLQLSHGIYKGAIAANGTELIVEISTNGIDFTPLTVPALPTGSGTASWHYRSITGVIPSVPALWIQFRHTSGTVQYRIDDILLSGTGGASQITADGPTSFCLGDSVVLSGGPGNNYLWNTGATTQDITVHSSGTYSVRIDCVPSADTNVVVSNCQSVTLNLKAYIQGFYIGNQTMIAVADPVNFPEICDTITVELSSASAPFGTVYAQTGVIDTSGLGSFVFPPATLNDSFYIVIKHRNSLETWSSVPVVFDNISTSYDFSTSAGKAFGNNLANMDGEFGLYSGDFTNGITPGVHDGVINELDFAGLESALGLFITGYSIYDLTGDRLVETSDFSLIESNLELGISVLKP
ncbi:MAG: hypothetical protein KA444_08900, partial [Bacteroidia bacterium]|nr:hypothetical protein [Bacteroidia bacterium]